MNSATSRAATSASSSTSSTRATHFEFTHPVFNVKGGYFAFMRPSDEVGFHFPLGEMFGVTPLERIQREFHLDPAGGDVRLLQTMAQGLRYVREIRPGDSIPKEILDGTASWSVEDRHHATARTRLDLQVWSWLKGREQVIVLRQSQDQVAGDPKTQRDVAAGHRVLAEALGFGEGGTEEVAFQLERIRREIVYIEALRDRYAFIREIAAALVRYNRVYGNHKTVEGEIGRARALMRTPLQLFDGKFAKVDTRTGQIAALLKNVDIAIELIRENRDDLHFGFMIWDGLIEKWKGAIFERSNTAVTLIKETYRFLATHYAATVPWTLSTQR
jgi:hypothetical protein